MMTMLYADVVRLRTLRSGYAVLFILVALVAGITGASLSDAGTEECPPPRSSASR